MLGLNRIGGLFQGAEFAAGSLGKRARGRALRYASGRGGMMGARGRQDWLANRTLSANVGTQSLIRKRAMRTGRRRMILGGGGALAMTRGRHTYRSSGGTGQLPSQNTTPYFGNGYYSS